MLIQNYNTSNPTFKGIGRLTAIEKVVNGVVKKRFILEAGEEHFSEAVLQGANLLVIKGGEGKAPILEAPIAIKNLLYQSDIQHKGITCNNAHIEGVREKSNKNEITVLRNLTAIHSDISSPLIVIKNCILSDSSSSGKTNILGDFYNKNESMVINMTIGGNAVNFDESKISGSIIKKDLINKDKAIVEGVKVEGNATNRDDARIENSTIDGTFCNRDNAKTYKVNVNNMVENWHNAEIRGGSILDLWNWSKRVFDVKITNNAWNNGNAEMCGVKVDGTLWAKDDSKALDVKAGRFESHGNAQLTNVTANVFRMHGKTNIFGYLKGHIAHIDPTVTIDPRAKIYTQVGNPKNSKLKRPKQLAMA